MAREKDNQTGRFIEGLIYDTPTYYLSRTPDGRIVSELSKGRKEADARHRDLMVAQGRVATGLQGVQAELRGVGSCEAPLPRHDPLLQVAEGIQRGQEDLIYEARVLNAVTVQGFSELGRRIDSVGDAVRDVGEGVHRVDANISGLRTDVAHHAREAQGPRHRQANLFELIDGRDELIQILAAYQRGQLNTQGMRELENLIRMKLASSAARIHVEQVLREVASDRVKAEATRRTRVLNNPEGLINTTTRDESIRSMRFVEGIAKEYPNQALTDFVLSLYALLNMFEEAGRAPVSNELLVELVNNRLATDAVSFEAKRTNRDARTEGSAVDRNFNLIEGLEQGDRMIEQGEEARQHRLAALTHLESLVALGKNSLENVARQRVEQGVKFLRKAETPEDYIEALELFRLAITEDPTLMGGQYGAAVTSEALDEMEEACKRYRIVGKMSEQPGIAAAAWQRYADIQARLGKTKESAMANEAAEEKRLEAIAETARAELEAKKRPLRQLYLQDSRLDAFRRGFEKISGEKPDIADIMKSLAQINPVTVNKCVYIDCLQYIERDHEGEMSVWISESSKLLVADSGLYSQEHTKVTFGQPTDRVDQILRSQGKTLLTLEEYYEFCALNSSRRYDLCENLPDPVTGQTLGYRFPTWVIKGGKCIPVGGNSQSVATYEEQELSLGMAVLIGLASWAHDFAVIAGEPRKPEKSSSMERFGVEGVRVGQRGVLRIPLLTER